MPWDAYDALGTRITQGRYDFLGALVSPAIAVTGAVTATISRMHYVTGTSADYTVTLPAASGNAGKHIAFVFGPTLTELSKLVTIDGNGGELINGSTNRVFWAGESLVLECDGSNWWIVDYWFKAMICAMTLAAQTLATATEAKILLDTTLTDNTGLMASVAGNEIICRRTGRYLFGAVGSFDNSVAACGLYQTYAKFNAGAGSTNLSRRFTSAAAQYVSTELTPLTYALTAGWDVELWSGQYSGGNQDVSTAILSLVEQPGW